MMQVQAIMLAQAIYPECYKWVLSNDLVYLTRKDPYDDLNREGIQGFQSWEEIIFVGESQISALPRWKKPRIKG
jgi:hypothetical protein